MRTREDVVANMQSGLGHEPDKTDRFQKAQNFEQVIVELLLDIRDLLAEINENTEPRG